MCDDGLEESHRIDLHSLGAIEMPEGLDGLGIDQSTARRVLAELQSAVVGLQEQAIHAVAKRKVATSAAVRLKDYRDREVQTLFGTVCLRLPRLL